MELRGKEISLRLTETPEELDEAWEVLCEPGVMASIHPDPVEITRSSFLRTLAGDTTAARFYLILYQDVIVGLEILSQIDRVHGTAVIPCIAVSRECKGRGVGVDATRTLVRYGFRSLGLQRIWYPTYAPLEKAKARAVKTGAVYEGTQRRAVLRDGEYVDRHLFAFLREE